MAIANKMAPKNSTKFANFVLRPTDAPDSGPQIQFAIALGRFRHRRTTGSSNRRSPAVHICRHRHLGIYAPEPSALPDSLNPPDIGDHASRVFEPSMTAHKGAETGMSFIITKAQKAELQRLGYSEEQIQEMKPEDAHRALGLIS